MEEKIKIESRSGSNVEIMNDWSARYTTGNDRIVVQAEFDCISAGQKRLKSESLIADKLCIYMASALRGPPARPLKGREASSNG